MITYLINYLKDNHADKIVKSYISDSNDDTLSEKSKSIKNVKIERTKKKCSC
jgi:hypothetical protein